MTRTVAILNCRAGEYRVIRDDSRKVNPYRIYRKWNHYDYEKERLFRHKNLVVSCEDLHSCLCYLKDVAFQYNEE